MVAPPPNVMTKMIHGQNSSQAHHRTVFKPARKISSFIRPIKDKIQFITEGVYKIPCSCAKIFICHTGRLSSTRIKEHVTHTNNQDTEKFAVAEYFTRTKHQINFDQSSLVRTCNKYYRRIILGPVEIQKHGNNMNKEGATR